MFICLSENLHFSAHVVSLYKSDLHMHTLKSTDLNTLSDYIFIMGS